MWKRRILWLILLILSIVGISFYGGAISYGLLCGVLLVPVVSLCYLLAIYLRFKIYQSIESRNVVCDQPVPYYFVLQNDDLFSFAGVSVRMFSDFSRVENMREDMEYELLPGESYRYDTRLICRYRGEYEVGVRECVVTDFFRLFSVTYRVSGRIQAIVLPKVVKLEQFQNRDVSVALMQKEVLTPPTQPGVTVRNYVAGDPQKQIHWKASARAQKLMVRERIGEEKQGISILLDTERYSGQRAEYLPLENKMLELVLALSYFFVEKKIPVCVHYPQQSLRRAYLSSLEAFDAFYHKTPDIVFSEGAELSGILGRIVADVAQSRIVFLVVHEMKEAYLDFRRQLLAGGTTVFFYVVSDRIPEEYLRIADCSGSLFTVPTLADLKEVL